MDVFLRPDCFARLFFLWLVLISFPLLAHEDTVYQAQEIVVETPSLLPAASKKTYSKDILELRPHVTINQLLEVVPGLTVIQHAGGGKATQYYLRGFDADHGTDIRFELDGLPINLVSHGHGQGFTDLNFIIPELVESLETDKGPYQADQGDFATAGSVAFKLKKEIKANEFAFSGGRFNTWRGLGLWGDTWDRHAFYFASEVYATDGPFENDENFLKLNLWGRGHFHQGNWETTLTTSFYQGDWNASGQIPLPLVESGVLSRFGSLDPSEGGQTRRFQFYAESQWTPSDRQQLKILPYYYHYDFNLFSNFTFFLEDPVNGDQIEQRDDREVFGLKLDYERIDEWKKVTFKSRMGGGFRLDWITNSLNHTVEREFLSSMVSNHIRQLNPYFFLEEDFQLTSWFRLVAGLRWDSIYLKVEDLLDQGVEGSHFGQIWQPKLSMIFSPHQKLDVFLNFGRGFHSNDARGVVDPVQSASLFAGAWGGELGFRLKPKPGLEVSVAAWLLHLESELVFVGDAGTTEPSDASLRTGVETEVSWKILPWLWAYGNFTWTHGQLLGVPSGLDAIALAPSWTLGAGLSADHSSGFYGSLSLDAIGDRPANEDNSLRAEGFMIWNLMAGYRFKNLKIFPNPESRLALQVDVINLFNAHYRSAQFATTSRPVAGGAVVDDIHF
ncbi:MAG: TonB-dependent receptor plug domain-containing protein, partial [Deltaproteobacteria bacterium]|nr:TonB-dependent receptor plug domain-containing protein [Deltaproteobacteria bacterium]